MTSDAEAMARAAVDLAATSPLSVDDALRVLAEAARLLAAAAIVRDLAAGDPAGEDFGAGPECVLCPANNLPSDREPTLDDHDPSCSWRRAVEWVSTQEDQT